MTDQLLETAGLEENEPTWFPWEVVEGSGFEISGRRGAISLIQASDRTFEVVESFRFTSDAVQADVVRQLRDLVDSEEECLERFELARTYTPGKGADGREKTTDLASVPRFLRWFENTYGLHTLAAILHDELIVDTPNGGALGSDTVSDRFFRKMLEASGVPWLKRWVMWTAVAARSRWAAEGKRRLQLVLWVLVALVGISSFVAATIWAFTAGGLPGGALLLFALALGLPFLSAPLWGRQAGASIIAAVAGVFVIPAAVFVLGGLATYWLIERLAGLVVD